MKKVIVISLLFFIVGCVNEQKEKDELLKVMDGYIHALEKAYQTKDVRILKPWAAPIETAQVKRNIKNLYYQGYALHPTLQSFKVTYVDVYMASNAFVKTEEVWNVKMINAHTQELVSEKQGEKLHVVYQLKKFDEEGWLVTSRIPEETKKRPW